VNIGSLNALLSERLVHIPNVLPLIVAFTSNNQIAIIFVTQLDERLDARRVAMGGIDETAKQAIALEL
jgi:hypothetical protein